MEWVVKSTATSLSETVRNSTLCYAMIGVVSAFRLISSDG